MKKSLIAISAVVLLSGASVGGKLAYDNYQAKEQTKQQTKAIIDDFYSLNSKLKTGINKLNYTEEVAKLQTNLDKFNRDNPQSEIYGTLYISLSDYKTASTYWSRCIEAGLSCTEQLTPLWDESGKAIDRANDKFLKIK